MRRELRGARQARSWSTVYAKARLIGRGVGYDLPAAATERPVVNPNRHTTSWSLSIHIAARASGRLSWHAAPADTRTRARRRPGLLPRPRARLDARRHAEQLRLLVGEGENCCVRTDAEREREND